MSLIMDALKRAQQLRLKESQGAPFFKNPPPKNRKSLTSLGKRWIIIGPVLACIIIAVFVFLKPTPSTLTTKPVQAVASIEKKPSLKAVEEIPPAPVKEIASPELIEGPQETLNSPKETLSYESIERPKDILSQPKDLQEKKVTSGMEPSVKEKKEEPLKKQVSRLLPHPQGKGSSVVKRLNPPPEESVKKDFNPTHFDSLKEEALSKPPEILKEEKNHPMTSEAIHYFNLGVSFYNEREKSKAIQAYQKATELNPAYVEAYNNLGIIYQELGDLDRALEAFQKAVEINPRYEKAYNNLGILLLSKDRLEEATEAFQKALAINPNNDESLINLGVLFRKQGQWDKGIEAYQKALTINPHRGETHYNIGLLYEEMGKIDLAVDHYQTFIQLSLKTYPVLASKVKSHLNYLLKVKNNREDSSVQGFKDSSEVLKK